MKVKSGYALAIIASFALGGASVRLLQAQAAPPAYVIAEISPTDPEGYLNNAVPILSKTVQDAGGVYLVRGGKTLSFEGAPPPPRVVVYRFDNMEQVRALAESQAQKEGMQIGEKYASFRIYGVEGVSPSSHVSGN
jgi:uncharacterized protein (DUF1330 family)